MRKLALTLASAICCLAVQAKDYKVNSPSGEIALTVSVNKEMTWTVAKGDETLLEPSRIGLEIQGRDLILSRILKTETSGVDRSLHAIVPTKFRDVKDCFNELKITFWGGWGVTFRVYDNGCAYRFETTFRDKNVNIAAEKAEFRFADDCSAYWAYETSPEYITHCEAFFKQSKLSELPADKYSYLPVSMVSSRGTRMVLTETDLYDYPNMFLFAGDSTRLEARFPQVITDYTMRTDRDITPTAKADYIASTSGTRTYPWRILTIGDDRSLLENTLSWQLATDCTSSDIEWIRPGKISWEWWAMLNVYGVDFKAGVNTETYKYYIDFAAAYGLEYILLDEGWSAGTMDVVTPMEGLDLQGLIEYGKSKGVGVVLWTLWTPVMADMEAILDVYQSWGVAGIKIDFMQRNDQPMVNFYEDVARECFKRHLLVDFHGSFKPSGLQRKYPNVMSYEGVYGMEHDKCSFDISPEHDLVLPFTRMVAGPMDYTPGATINATKDDFAMRWYHPMSQGTRAHQAAIFVVYESCVQMLCDSPSNYYKVPEFTSFIASVPTVWDETRAIEAVAGDYLLLARRSGDTWYAAGLNDWTARELTLALDFLGEGEWEARIFRDGVNANSWAEDYKVETVNVTSSDILPVCMANGGGWAAVFTRK